MGFNSTVELSSRKRGLHWRTIFGPGVALAVIALAMVAAVGTVDASLSPHHLTFLQLLTPDPIAAAWTMALLGTSEGVAIAIVIVVVVLGVQLTADRYSPRIIDIFIRDRMNALVLALFLGSIVFTIWISTEIKPDYVPYYGVFFAIGLAIVDFAVLLPYVRYMFQIMRGEAIIDGIRGRAAHAIAAAAANPNRQVHHRHEVREAISQLVDIALGSIQEGDTEVALAALHCLRHLVCDEYLPRKTKFEKKWMTVGHEDMPGASDQTIIQVDRTNTWLEHSILASFVDLMGETPAFRKEIIHAIAITTRDMGRQAVRHVDPELLDLVLRFFNTYFRASMNQRAPTFAYAVMNEYRRFASDSIEEAPDLSLRVAEHMLRYGRAFDAAGMPFIIGTAAEDVSTLVQEMAKHDPDRALLLTASLAQALAEMAPHSQPVSLNGILKAVIKLALWALAESRNEITAPLCVALLKVRADAVENALGRMESTTEKVFWEVSDRVVAYDWVEDGLRELIPILRTRLFEVGAPDRNATPRLKGAPPAKAASTSRP